MSTTKNTIIKAILMPLSWIYGIVMFIRNWMFDKNFLPQRQFDIPVVTVGNISVGGTGKTPHTEYIVSKLADSYNIAILSRGYKRKTKGFIVVNSQSTPANVGDEPLQMYKKLGPDVIVAVCENRRKGIEEICKNFPNIDLIVLDDGFQHRYVKPKISVLLIDYNRPIYEDDLLPLGRLRESAIQMNRADMVVFTKCPRDLTPIDYRIMSKKLDLMPYQNLYFSSYNYGDLKPVFPEDDPMNISLKMSGENDAALLLTGIANPRPFVKYFKHLKMKIKVMHFSDHHNFTRKDMKNIERRFNDMSGCIKFIITTEKDAIRLQYNPYYPTSLKRITYYLPISVKMTPALENSDIISDLKKAINAAPL